jgi:molybdate transport system substrate-binding protein
MLFVGAPVSMQAALEQIADAFQRTRPVDVTVTYADSAQLRRKVEARDPLDVLITATPADLEALARAGRVSEPRWLGRDSLVVVVPRAAPRTPRSVHSLTRSRYKRIAIGDPASVTSGVHAVGAFRSARVYEKLRPRFVYLPSEDEVLERVRTGEVQAGIVCRTQALSERRKVRVAFRLPVTRGQRIVYGAAPTAHASNPALAAEFTKFLKSRQSRTILRKYGFQPAPRTRSASLEKGVPGNGLGARKVWLTARH